MSLWRKVIGSRWRSSSNWRWTPIPRRKSNIRIRAFQASSISTNGWRTRSSSISTPNSKDEHHRHHLQGIGAAAVGGYPNAFMATFVDAAIASKDSPFAEKAADWSRHKSKKFARNWRNKEGKLEEFQISAKLLEASTADADIEQVVAVTSDLSKAKEDLIALKPSSNAPSRRRRRAIRNNLENCKPLTRFRQPRQSEGGNRHGANDAGRKKSETAGKAFRRKIDGAADRPAVQSYHQKLLGRISAQKDKITKLETASEAGRSTMIGIQGKRQQFTSLKNDVAFYRDELDPSKKPPIRRGCKASCRFQTSR